jgi:large subunit ribosomal protein L2
MEIKKHHAISNSNRHHLNLKKNLLSKTNKIIKSNFKGFKKFCGRSSRSGHITSRHKGSGKKNSIRLINVLTNNKNLLILSTIHDPLSTSFVNITYDFNTNTFHNIFATKNIYPGMWISRNTDLNEIKLGYKSYLKSFPVGSLVNNITLKNEFKSKYIKSAGTFGQIIQSTPTYVKVKMPSSKIICFQNILQNEASLGIISNIKNNLISIGKAGRNRNLGVRPSVRGIAMNPVDHPHGGRTNGGRVSVSPWGIISKCGFKLKKYEK